VQDLQFKVKRKLPSPHAAERPIEPVDLKTIGLAIRLGISQDKAEKLLLKYGAKAMDEALMVLDERQRRPNMEPVRTPEKYLRTILQSGQFGAALEIAPRAIAVYDTKAERLKLIERFMAQKRAQLNEMFQEMPGEDQRKWIAKFDEEALAGSGAVRKAFQSKGIASPIVRPAFLKFLGNAVWEDGWDKPTDSDLVDLAILAKNEQEQLAERRPGSRARVGMAMKKT
ncbi:MAG: hypothetical protein ACREX0_18920, partial [Noviherbaspirillum sp.]